MAGISQQIQENSFDLTNPGGSLLYAGGGRPRPGLGGSSGSKGKFITRISPTSGLFMDQYGTQTVKEIGAEDAQAGAGGYSGAGGGAANTGAPLGAGVGAGGGDGGLSMGGGPLDGLAAAGFSPLQAGSRQEGMGQAGAEGAGVVMGGGMEPSAGFIEGIHGQLRALGRRSPPQTSMALAGLRNIY